jgi:hypothetical protein
MSKPIDLWDDTNCVSVSSFGMWPGIEIVDHHTPKALDVIARAIRQAQVPVIGSVTYQHNDFGRLP